MIDSIEIPSLDKIKTESEMKKEKKNKKKKKNSKTPIKQNSQSLNSEDFIHLQSKSKNKNSDKKSSAYKSLINKIRSNTPKIMTSLNLDKNFKGSPFSKTQNNFYRINSLQEDESDNVNNLRNKFQYLLGKLNENSTKEIAFNQLKELIKETNTPEALRIYLSCLSKYDPTSSMNAKEIYVLLYGYISSIYKENLKDPLDKPPNLIKTINRIINHIKQFYLNQNSYNVHKASSRSICELYDNCMPKDNVKKIYISFIQIFIDVISIGNDKVSQEGSAICLSDLIYHFGSEKKDINNKILDTLDDNLIALCSKSSLDNPYLFEALFNLIKFTNIENYKNYINELYQRFIIILCKVNRNKYNYLTKIFCLNILSLIAEKVKNNKEIIKDFYEENMITIIESNSKDKVLKVQNAAKEALINWYELKEKFEEKDLKKSENNLNEDNENEIKINLKSKNQKMDKLNFLRDLARMAKTENNKVDYDSELPEKMKEEVYKKGIGNILQLSRFLNKVKNKNNENQLRNSLKKMKNNQKEINDFLKQTNQMKKYNEYKKEEKSNNNDKNENQNKFDFQIEEIKSGNKNEKPYINDNDLEIKEDINEENEEEENENNSEENNKNDNKKEKKIIEKNKTKKKIMKKKKEKKENVEEEDLNNANEQFFEENEKEKKSISKKKKSKTNESNEEINNDEENNNEEYKNDENTEKNNEDDLDDNNNEEDNENDNKENIENNEEEEDLNSNNEYNKENNEEEESFIDEKKKKKKIEIIMKKNIKNKKDLNFLRNRNKQLKQKEKIKEENIKNNKTIEESQNQNKNMLKNEKILNQISQENKKLKSQNVSSNKIIDSLEIEEDNKERNILKEKKNKIFLPKIQEQNKKMITNKSKELDKFKETMQSMINNKIFKSINNFEKDINSKLDDINNRLNDVSLKIQNYVPNKNIKDKNEDLLKEKTIMYQEVLNDIKKDLLSNQLKHNENKELNDSQIMKIWKMAINKVEKNNLIDAYNLILNCGDDIYLLRLIYLTGMGFEKLSPEICRKILIRINKVTRSHQIQSLLVNLVKNSFYYNIFNTLNENEQNDILDTLYEISGYNNSLAKEAAELYTKITK